MHLLQYFLDNFTDAARLQFMAHKDWLEKIYRDHAPALFGFLIRLTGNESETKDTLQEIFLRLAKSPLLLQDVVGIPGHNIFITD